MSDRPVIQVTWTDRRRASCVRQFAPPASANDVLRFLKTLKCKATVRASDAEDPIGGVWDAQGFADDKRLRWVWWLDREAAAVALEAA